MDEPETNGPQQPGDGPPADDAPAAAEAAQALPAAQASSPGRADRLRGALVSRAAGWVVAVALAGAVVALSAVLATTPQGLQVRALAGPVTITEVPVPGARLPAISAGPGQVRLHGVPAFRVLCEGRTGPQSFWVAVPTAPGGKQVGRAVVVKPGSSRLVPVVECPLR